VTVRETVLLVVLHNNNVQGTKLSTAVDKFAEVFVITSNNENRHLETKNVINVAKQIFVDKLTGKGGILYCMVACVNATLGQKEFVKWVLRKK
jgi:hypothetical protein